MAPLLGCSKLSLWQHKLTRASTDVVRSFWLFHFHFHLCKYLLIPSISANLVAQWKGKILQFMVRHMQSFQLGHTSLDWSFKMPLSKANSTLMSYESTCFTSKNCKTFCLNPTRKYGQISFLCLAVQGVALLKSQSNYLLWFVATNGSEVYSDECVKSIWCMPHDTVIAAHHCMKTSAPPSECNALNIQ